MPRTSWLALAVLAAALAAPTVAAQEAALRTDMARFETRLGQLHPFRAWRAIELAAERSPHPELRERVRQAAPRLFDALAPRVTAAIEALERELPGQLERDVHRALRRVRDVPAHPRFAAARARLDVLLAAGLRRWPDRLLAAAEADLGRHPERAALWEVRLLRDPHAGPALAEPTPLDPRWSRIREAARVVRLCRATLRALPAGRPLRVRLRDGTVRRLTVIRVRLELGDGQLIAEGAPAIRLSGIAPDQHVEWARVQMKRLGWTPGEIRAARSAYLR